MTILGDRPDLRDRVLSRLSVYLSDVVLTAGSDGTIEAKGTVRSDFVGFTGHFPGHPLLAGAFQIQIMTLLVELVEPRARVAGIGNARFSKMIGPGDRLEIEIVRDPQASNLARFKGTIRAGREARACQATMLVSFDDETGMRYPESLSRVGVDGTDMAYLDAGRGRPVLMLHGFTFNASCFKDQFGPMVSAGYRPIVPDIPPFGRSPMPPGFGARAEDYVQRILGLLDAIGIHGPLPVVGHSLGGGLALFLALEQPSRVSSVIAIAPASEPSHKALRVARVSGQAGFDEVAPVFFTRDRLVSILSSAYGAAVPDEATLASYVEGVDVVQAFGVVRSFFSPAFTSMRERYADIRVPVLIVVGSDDPHDPVALSQRPAMEIPGARLMIVSRTAHCPHQESPGSFNTVMLDFLGRLLQ